MFPKSFRDSNVVEETECNRGFPDASRSEQCDGRGPFHETQQVVNDHIAAEEMCGGFREGWRWGEKSVNSRRVRDSRRWACIRTFGPG